MLWRRPVSRAGLEGVAHLLFPGVGFRRAFGDEDPVGPGGDGAHQGQVAAVAAHDLDHEGALVAGGGAGDGVDGLGDAVQGGIRADGHIRPEHVVVDRADQPGHDQVRMGLGLLLGDLPRLDQLAQQLRPFLAQDVGPGQAAVAADDDQAIDAVQDQVAGGFAAALPRAELRAAGGADHRAALLEDAAHRRPVHLADVLATVDHALVAFVDRVDVQVALEGGAHDGAHGGVHPWGIATAGQDADAASDLFSHHEIQSLGSSGSVPPLGCRGMHRPDRARECGGLPAYRAGELARGCREKAARATAIPRMITGAIFTCSPARRQYPAAGKGQMAVIS